MMRENLQIVRNYIDANELLEMGFTMSRVSRDLDDTSRFIFFFKYEDGIKKALKEISSRYKNNK